MRPRTVALLADCGPAIGLGHLRRSLVLAGAFAEAGLRVRVATPNGAGDSLVMAAGFEPLPWPERPRDLPAQDVLVIDHYGISAATMAQWRYRAMLRVAIDDLADHPIDADLIINQNLFAADLRYDTIAACPILRGPSYALVDPKFTAIAGSRGGIGKRVLVSFGGSDDGTLAAAAARALRRAGFSGRIDAAISPLRQLSPELIDAALAADPGLTLHQGSEMTELMTDAFLYIGGAGTTIFEAAVAGLAMLPIGIAENQRRNVEALRRHGVGALMGFDEEQLAAALRTVLADPARSRLVDAVGSDGAHRIIGNIFARLSLRDRSELSLCL